MFLKSGGDYNKKKILLDKIDIAEGTISQAEKRLGLMENRHEFLLLPKKRKQEQAKMQKKKRAQSMDSDIAGKRGKKKGGPATDESITEHPKLPEIVKLLSQIYRILVGLETDRIPKKKSAA